MKKFGLLFLVLVGLFAACGDVHNPNGPEPVKQYTLEITYVRVDVVNLNSLSSIPAAEVGSPNGSTIADIFFMRVDDYTFKGGVDKLAPGIYGLAADDHARGDCASGTIQVGHRFFVRVKETAYEKEITSVVPFTLQGYTCTTGNSRMAKFQLFDNGTLDNVY